MSKNVTKKKVLILIPARFKSTRFPGKPLVLINGQSMISRVYANCQNASAIDLEFETCVVTDDEQIENHIKNFQGKVVRVDDDVVSGTLRISMAYDRFFKNQNFDLIINVQGDEPLLKGEDLVKLASFHLNSRFDLTTLVKKQIGFNQIFYESNKVKVAMSEINGSVFYFSRAGIPFKRDEDLKNNALDDYWFLHIGVYSYRPIALSLFSNAKESRLENLEKLEQLRALEIGLTVGATETNHFLMGVDVPSDVETIESYMNKGIK